MNVALQTESIAPIATVIRAGSTSSFNHVLQSSCAQRAVDDDRASSDAGKSYTSMRQPGDEPAQPHAAAGRGAAKGKAADRKQDEERNAGRESANAVASLLTCPASSPQTHAISFELRGGGTGHESLTSASDSVVERSDSSDGQSGQIVSTGGFPVGALQRAYEERSVPGNAMEVSKAGSGESKGPAEVAVALPRAEAGRTSGRIQSQGENSKALQELPTLDPTASVSQKGSLPAPETGTFRSGNPVVRIPEAANGKGTGSTRLPAHSKSGGTPGSPQKRTTTERLQLREEPREVSLEQKRDREHGDPTRNPGEKDILDATAPAANVSSESNVAASPMSLTTVVHQAVGPAGASVPHAGPGARAETAVAPRASGHGNENQLSNNVAAASTLNSARLLHRVGESQLRVGVHTAELGNVEIRTSLVRQHLMAEISVDRPEVSSILAAELPALHSRLQHAHGTNVDISVHNNHAGMSSGGHAGSNTPSHEPQRLRFHSTAEQAVPRELVVPSSMSEDDERLDLHV